MMGSPGAGADESAATDRPSTEAVLDLLSHRDRRVVLRTMLDQSGPVAVEELADRLARGSAGRGSTDGSGEPGAPDRVLIRLHHVHLPKLADAGALQYDPDRREVTAPDDLAGLRPFLDPGFTGTTESEVTTE